MMLNYSVHNCFLTKVELHPREPDLCELTMRLACISTQGDQDLPPSSYMQSRIIILSAYMIWSQCRVFDKE